MGKNMITETMNSNSQSSANYNLEMVKAHTIHLM